MSSGTPHPVVVGRTVREEAADWMALRRSGTMSADDMRAFKVWLDADPGHRTAFANLEHYWEFLGGVRDDAEIMALRELRLKQANRPARYRIAAAIAASIVVVTGMGWGMFEVGAFDRMEWLRKPQEAEFRTSVGQRTTVTLSDGSIVTLDTDSVLRSYESGRRRMVKLERGRAFFKVAKDPSRPFIVTVADTTVTAVGTAFDVRLKPAGMEVTMSEGKVRVEQPDDRTGDSRVVDVRAGYRLTAPKGDTWVVAAVDLKKEASWLAGRLTFMDDRLADAVVEMNRYSAKKIVLTDPALADRSIVGIFRAGDVESFARAAEVYGLARIGSSTEDRIELRPF